MTIHPALRERLLITAGLRPASVFYRNGEVRILEHDEWYHTRRLRMLEDLKALHPDTSKFHEARRDSTLIPATCYRPVNLGRTFDYAVHILGVWEAEQEKWYAVFGLKPPKHAIRRPAPIQKKRKLWKYNTGVYKPPLETAMSRGMAAAESAWQW